MLLCGLRFGFLPDFDRRSNPVLLAGPYPVSNEIKVFHNEAFVADLHADPLLWGRDLSRALDRGQVDLPRLRSGGVDLQVFSVVSQVPSGLNVYSNPADSDILPMLFIASWRPPSTWFSVKKRALTQASELRDLASSPGLTLVLGRDDLSAAGLKGLLALEGMHALEGDPQALDEFFSAGFRMMGLTHFFDNAVAGSAHGREKYGLTEFGRSQIPRMEALGITIDLAHASPAALRDTLALATRPVVVSHGGVNAVCPGPRNLTNPQLRAVAANGGVIGIGYWKVAVCDPSPAGIVASIRHVIDVAGIDHVGLGSDFDGNVTTAFDATGLPQLTEALLASGLTRDQVARVLGGNVRRVLAANLPR